MTETYPDTEEWEGIIADSHFGIERVGWGRIHSRRKCEGEYCPFHNPSDHPLRDASIVLRLDKSAIVERRCAHGIGHTDPDSIRFLLSQHPESPEWHEVVNALVVHGCDGCCGWKGGS